MGNMLAEPPNGKAQKRVPFFYTCRTMCSMIEG